MMTSVRNVRDMNDFVAPFIWCMTAFVIAAVVFYTYSLDMESRLPCLRIENAILADLKRSRWGIACGEGLDGQKLMLNGSELDRAIVAHATTRIRYYITEKKFRLRGRGAIPDYINGAPGTSVIFNIYAGGQLLKSSGLIRGGKQFYFDIPVENARELTLEITDGGNGEFRDHALWTGLELVTQ